MLKGLLGCKTLFGVILQESGEQVEAFFSWGPHWRVRVIIVRFEAGIVPCFKVGWAV